MKYFEIFWIFLKLGCTSFGGPIAHLLYFRQTFVQTRAWLNDDEYSSIVALCQTLPGPASSQVGFTIGFRRGGLLGALLAFIGFTFPSVFLLLVFANYLFLFDSSLGLAALQGLAILALAVVLHGVIGMGKNLCFDKPRIMIALLTFVTMLLAQSIFAQVAVIFVGAFVGFTIINEPNTNAKGQKKLNANTAMTFSWLPSMNWLLLSISLFIALPFVSQTANEFYRSGALVFGGGHVVLPLLEEAVVSTGQVTQSQFLAGYGATQAVPGPMFTFASYLGFIQANEGGISGALIATIFIFLPGFLLVLALYPVWQSLSANQALKNAVAGANAAVVGLLAAALYDPIFIHAIQQSSDLAIAAMAFIGLSRFNVPVLWVVLFCVLVKAILVLM